MHDLDALSALQRTLSHRVIIRDAFKTPVTRVAGIDLAFIGDVAITACVITAVPPVTALAEYTVLSKLDFPYRSGFLSFREGPPIIALVTSLASKADLFLINAHGLAHPRFYGCASHVGVVTGAVTIGVTARNLCGVYTRAPQGVGSAVAAYYRERQVGWVVQSKAGCRPIFVSPGHKINLDSTLELVTACLCGHKLPEPLWLAHGVANSEKRRRQAMDSGM